MRLQDYEQDVINIGGEHAMQVCELFESDYAKMATYLRMVDEKLLLLNPRVQAPTSSHTDVQESRVGDELG